MAENVHGDGKKPRKLKMQTQFENNIIKNIKKIKLKKQNEDFNHRIIKDIINLFE